MDDQTTLIAVVCGFLLCLFGTVVLLTGNLIGGTVLLGLGLIIVAVLAGFVEKLFDLFADIFGSIFGR